LYYYSAVGVRPKDSLLETEFVLFISRFEIFGKVIKKLSSTKELEVSLFFIFCGVLGAYRLYSSSS